MVDLQKNIQQEHMDTEEHLNSLYAKNGNVKQGQDCAKSFDEQMITQSIEQKERVKNILEFLKKERGHVCRQKVPETKHKKKQKKERSKEQRRNLKR